MQAKPIPKSEQIYEFLRRAIVRLELAPGTALSEPEICAQFDVSRTPVREAVQKLAEEGLVNVFPQSGTYVSRISYEVAEEGFIIRRALEIESARRAAIRVTDPQITQLHATIGRMRAILTEDRLPAYIDEDDIFHASISEISGLPRIWKFITLAKVHLDRMRQLSAPVPGHLAEVTEQHAAIVHALARRKPDHAELAMRIHLDGSFEVMSRMLEDKIGLFQEES